MLDISKFSEYRDFVIVQLLLDTGMRISECLMIKVNDLNLVKRFIWLPAKKHERKTRQVGILFGEDGRADSEVDQVQRPLP